MKDWITRSIRLKRVYKGLRRSSVLDEQKLVMMLTDIKQCSGEKADWLVRCYE